MQTAAKNMRKNLVVTKESAIFVMPNIHKTDTPLLSLFYSGSLCGNGVNLLSVWRHLQRGYRFLCIHIKKLLSTLCQTQTKADLSGRTVPILHPYSSGKGFTAANWRKRIFPKHPNSIKLLSTANTGIRPSNVVSEPALPTCIRSIIRTWQSVGRSSHSWRHRRSPASTTSASANRLRKRREKSNN